MTVMKAIFTNPEKGYLISQSKLLAQLMTLLRQQPPELLAGIKLKSPLESMRSHLPVRG